MIPIVVDCPHGRTEFSLEEAEQLVATLNKKIAEVHKVSSPLSAFIERDEYFCRKELFQFFRQFLPEQHISRRIGKLYATIVRAGMTGWRSRQATPLFEIVCAKCDLSLDKTCKELDGHQYYRNKQEYYVNIAALRQHAAAFMPGGSQEILGTKLESFRLLMENL